MALAAPARLIPGRGCGSVGQQLVYTVRPGNCDSAASPGSAPSLGKALPTAAAALGSRGGFGGFPPTG